MNPAKRASAALLVDVSCLLRWMRRDATGVAP
jgi:hypothetical protein